MEDANMLELLGMIRNVKPQMEDVGKGKDNHPEEQQELQPALYQLNLIKDTLQNVPSDSSNFSGLAPCSQQSGLSTCSQQSGLPPCSQQSGLPPCSQQSGLSSCSQQSGLSSCSQQSGLPPCSQQSDVTSGLSCQSGSALQGHSFSNDKTYPNRTGIISILPGTPGEGQIVEGFEGQPLTHSFLISQIAYVTHRVQPNQEYECAITKHKIMDVLNNPFMCGICGNIFSTTALLRLHIIKDHCLNIPPEHGHSDGSEGGVAVSKEDQKPKKSDYEKNVLGKNMLGNISDAILIEGSEKNQIGRQVADGEHSTADETSVQEKRPVNLKNRCGQKVERKRRRKGDGKRKQLGGKLLGSTDAERNRSNENSPQKKIGCSEKEADENLVNSDPILVVNKAKEPKRFKCEFCEEIFTSNRYRYKHRVASHPDCSFTCPNCDKMYKVDEKDKWQHHMRNHNRPPRKTKQDSYNCHLCSMVFRAASSVSIHMQTFHPELVQVDKPFCCEVCGKLFRTKRTIKLHQTLVHSDEKPYECQTCGRGFKTESYLKLHTRTHTGEKPYACKFCDKTFPSTGGRRAHERTHTNERPYKCSYCGRGFKAKPQLVEHERTHTKEKPFVCPICSKAFASRTSFATHKFLHTGKKPFQCSHCSRAFAQKCNLEHHVRSIHTLEKPHQCTVCGVGFARTTGRSSHMEKKHGIKVSLRRGHHPLYTEAQGIEQIVQPGCVSIDVSSGIMGHALLDDTLSLVVESLNG